jgi:RNA polymerase-binding transcription factor DksA
VLSAEQKRDLLVARATRLREEEGGRSVVADARDPRGEELSVLEEDLFDERREIAEANRRARAEAGGALRRNPRPLGPSEKAELPIAATFIAFGDELRELRTARLDAIDRALDALARGARFDCLRCKRPIETARLREAPDTVVCMACAEEALPVDPLPGPPPAPARPRTA